MEQCIKEDMMHLRISIHHTNGQTEAKNWHGLSHHAEVRNAWVDTVAATAREFMEFSCTQPCGTPGGVMEGHIYISGKGLRGPDNADEISGRHRYIVAMPGHSRVYVNPADARVRAERIGAKRPGEEVCVWVKRSACRVDVITEWSNA